MISELVTDFKDSISTMKTATKQVFLHENYPDDGTL